MKQTTIPYIPHEQLDWQSLALQLETQGVRLHIDTLNWAEAYPYHPIVLVDLAYTSKGIALSYFVRGLELRTLSEGDGHYVHEDSCVEFFMQPSRGEAYINFEFNAAGVCYASHHSSPKESVRFSAEEYAMILRQSTHQGQRLNLEEGLHSWQLQAFIPWRTMGYAEGEIPERLWANFYKCADGTKHPHYLSWAPIEEAEPAFHRPQFFGELTLGPR